ncbi:unnamed protein product [Pleuronectes platessa]|uniref:Uncharacterized protein n=1 Tax=Pleuronectes platessa TaxID=8262 RepID=A0A9N7U364_PLEPL|nr:unnamed protein product [Pleuronectes platessa]
MIKRIQHNKEPLTATLAQQKHNLVTLTSAEASKFGNTAGAMQGAPWRSGGPKRPLVSLMPRAGPEQHESITTTEMLSDYVDNLLDLIFHEVFQDPAPYVNEVLKISKPEDLSAKYEKPDKQEVIGRSEPCITSLSIREHSAYLEHRAGGQDHPDSPAQVASTPAHKASYGY